MAACGHAVANVGIASYLFASHTQWVVAALADRGRRGLELRDHAALHLGTGPLAGSPPDGRLGAVRISLSCVLKELNLPGPAARSR